MDTPLTDPLLAPIALLILLSPLFLIISIWNSIKQERERKHELRERFPNREERKEHLHEQERAIRRYSEEHRHRWEESNPLLNPRYRAKRDSSNTRP
jgi:hypothetical protein